MKKRVETIEQAMLVLEDEFREISSATSMIDTKIINYAETKINPMINEFQNQSKVHEGIIREFSRK